MIAPLPGGVEPLQPRDYLVLGRFLQGGAPPKPEDLATDRARALLKDTLSRLTVGVEPIVAFRAVLEQQPDAAQILREIFKVDPGAAPTAEAGTEGAERPRHSWSHAALMAAEFPPISYVVDGLVAASGLTLLGGKRKHGKSWMCLQIAQAAAAGGQCLGRHATQGSVLYLALEDGATRLQGRLRKQLAPPDLPIQYEFKFRPLNAGGLDDLGRLIDAQRPVLVTIDTLAAAKTGKVRENDAGDMADILNALHALSQEKETGIVVVVHHGKGTGGDVGDDIRGSSALAAAADITLGLYKTDNGAVLKAEGRDIEEIELRVEFDAATTWTWQLVGDARQIAKQEAEKAILDALADGSMTTRALCEEVGKTKQTILQTLKRMHADGRVTKATIERSGSPTPLWARR